MEPVLTMISDALLKALGYLNVFIKALTGVDYIARANAKALDKQAKSQKGLNKATQDYDFDVIRKQQEVSSESSSSTSGVSGLIEIPELNESLVNKIQKLGEFLKDNGVEALNYEDNDEKLGEFLSEIVEEKLKNTNEDYNWAKVKPLYIQPPSISKPKAKNL